MKKLFILTVALAMAAMPALAQDNYAAWQDYQTVTINTTSSGANVTNPVMQYPVLVRLGISDSTVFSAATATGADIRFSKMDGAHLPYQIDQWDPVDKTAAIWVLLDTVKGNANTLIKMYFGNSSAADSSNGKAVFAAANGFAAVYHLDEDSGGATGNAIYKDATGNQAAGANDVSVMGNDGYIGRGTVFGDTVNNTHADYIDLGTWEPSDTQMTFSAWLKYTPATIGANWYTIIAKRDNGGSTSTMRWQFYENNYSGEVGGTGPSQLCQYSGTTGDSTYFHVYQEALQPGVWTHVTWTTINGGLSGLYIDGVPSSTSTAVIFNWGTAAAADLKIGRTEYSGEGFAGTIDEARFSSIIRSPDWIKLDYQTQVLGSTAITLGPTTPNTAVLANQLKRGENNVFDVQPLGRSIMFRIPDNAGHTTILLIALSGRTVATLRTDLGVKELTWSGNLTAGAYIARIFYINSKSGEKVTQEKRVSYTP